MYTLVKNGAAQQKERHTSAWVAAADEATEGRKPAVISKVKNEAD